MGTYATTTSLDTLMPDTTFNTATTSLGDKCITQAEDCIKGMLSQRYDMSSATFQTSTSTPPLITMLAERLSMGYMYQSLSRGSKQTESRADNYIKSATMKLKEIRDGKVDLTDSSGDPVDERTDSKWIPQSNTEDYTDTFDEDDSLNWEIDADKISDIQSEKI